MSKFQVGDKVRILNARGIRPAVLTNGNVYNIVEVDKTGFYVIDDEGDKSSIANFEYDYVELAELKKTKNERISELESQVDNLQKVVESHKDQIDKVQQFISQLEIRFGRSNGKTEFHKALIKAVEPSTTDEIIEFEGNQYRKVDREARERDLVVFKRENDYYKSGKPYQVLSNVQFVDEDGDEQDVYNVFNRKPQYVDVYEIIKQELTPNQQRAEIIEKAKKFVEEHGEGFNFVSEHNCTLIWKPTPKGIFVEGAKCNPSDVFNEHIGKAIALGRALGLDVSEFEQAVKPDEVVEGHKIEWNGTRNLYDVIKKDGSVYKLYSYMFEEPLHHLEYKNINELCRIINDTNAQYEV